MSDNLHPVFRKALAPFAPPISRPVRTAMVQVLDAPQPANDATIVHTITRESLGCGFDGGARMKCSCGWEGPRRDEMSDSMCADLRRDESGHAAAVRGMA